MDAGQEVLAMRPCRAPPRSRRRDT